MDMQAAHVYNVDSSLLRKPWNGKTNCCMHVLWYACKWGSIRGDNQLSSCPTLSVKRILLRIVLQWIIYIMSTVFVVI